MSMAGTRCPLRNTPFNELLSTAIHLPWSNRSSTCARAINGCATRRSARTSLPTTMSWPAAKTPSARSDRTVSKGCAGRVIRHQFRSRGRARRPRANSSAPGPGSAFEPDVPSDDGGIPDRQQREHGHVEYEDVLGVLPDRVVGRYLLDLHQRREVDGGRARRVAPAGGRQPRELFETEALVDRDHSAGEHQL